MRYLFVTGGQQRSPAHVTAGDGCSYEKGILLCIDSTTGERLRSMQYVSPPETTANGHAEVVFKAGTIAGDRLYVCTQTEVMIYDLTNFQLLNHVSLPCFNDLHHVRPTADGNLLVANTGLDIVLLMTPAGDVIREWNVIGGDAWQRFAKDVDYRYIDTKPHAAHPNYVFAIGDEVWATRFHAKDAVCLTNPLKRIDIQVGSPHDGLLHNGKLFFTTVNGYVAIADPKTLNVEELIDLSAISGSDVQLGWCRGLFIDDGKAWIGFSRLRSTKFRENVKWVVQGFKKALPTRVACYDLEQKQCLQEIDLERYGLNAVYSILPAEEVAMSCRSAIANESAERQPLFSYA